MVAEDEKAYSECWAAICADSDAVGRLLAATDDLNLRVCSTTALHAAAAAAANASFTVTVPGEKGISRIRQLSRRQRPTNVSDGKMDVISRPGYDDGRVIGPPVKDLDLLFAQAKGLLPHLRRKVRPHTTPPIPQNRAVPLCLSNLRPSTAHSIVWLCVVFALQRMGDRSCI
jgi:hypothetical protein